jgi:hypothetical protein
MPNKDTLLYTPIDFIGNEAQAKKFAIETSEFLLEAKRKIEHEKFPIHLSFKTTFVRGQGGSQDAVDYFCRGISKLTEAGIDYSVDNWGSGPTKAMYETIFNLGNLTAGFGGISTGDLDQFPPQQNLENILNLWERVKKENAILGVGSRSCKVILSKHHENSYLRRIFEGIMNMAVKESAILNNHTICCPENYSLPDNQYSRTGDFVTGVYLTNLLNDKTENLIHNLVSSARLKNFFGFEGEYFMTLLSASEGNLAVEVMNSIKNPFENKMSVGEERENIIEKKIKSPLLKLRQTPAAHYILSSLDKSKRLLKDFYPIKQVEEVENYIIESLNS